jgi:hypothetical protein
LSRLEVRIERRADRFDRWESCLRWQPVTSAGDLEQDLGYVVATPPGEPRQHRPALDLDLSEWDDPDYQLLSFGGRDRPFGTRECGGEPGESVDRVAPRRADTVRGRSGPGARQRAARGAVDGDLQDLRQGVAELREDVEDLVEPVGEITQFDECMFTVGAREHPGYEYMTPRGRVTHRSTLSYDLRGPGVPVLNLLAFPGEEPPQIECNEDAAGEGTDE